MREAARLEHIKCSKHVEQIVSAIEHLTLRLRRVDKHKSNCAFVGYSAK